MERIDFEKHSGGAGADHANEHEKQSSSRPVSRSLPQQARPRQTATQKLCVKNESVEKTAERVAG